MGKEVLFEGRNLSKHFGETKALSDVSLQIRAGEIHGLVGENGSGKSTLSSLIVGNQKADEGEMLFCGKPYHPVSSVQAAEQGICMVVQEQGTFDKLTVTENIFLGREKEFRSGGLLKVGQMQKKARDLMAALGIEDIDEKVLAEKISFEEKKLIEIVRSMYSDPKIIIIDETTTALSQKGRTVLYKLIQRLKTENKAVVFISHDLEEVMEYCDCLTVLKDGNLVKTLNKAEFDEHLVKSLMVGREISENYYREDLTSSHQEDVTLEMQDVSTEKLKHISLKMHAGEIVGVGGLADCGMHEIGKVCFGLDRIKEGTVTNRRTPITSTKVAMKTQIAYLAKDRDKESLMTAATIQDNICLPSYPQLAKGGLVSKVKEKKYADKWAKYMMVKMQNIKTPVSSLSGGNKQKVVIAKWLGFGADVFIMDCPTRGIDIGVKQRIYQLMMELKNRGKTILLISEELTELIGMSDRVVIMKDGSIAKVFQRDDHMTESELIQYML